MVSAFDDDGLAQVRKLIDQIEAASPSHDNTASQDPDGAQTQQIVRALRILTDQVDQLRSERE